jgi:hypothetical protein
MAKPTDIPSLDIEISAVVARTLVADNLNFQSVGPEKPGGVRAWNFVLTLQEPLSGELCFSVFRTGPLLVATAPLKFVQPSSAALASARDAVNNAPFARAVLDPHESAVLWVRSEFPIDEHSPNPISIVDVRAAWMSVMHGCLHILKVLGQQIVAFEPTTIPIPEMQSGVSFQSPAAVVNESK